LSPPIPHLVWPPEPPFPSLLFLFFPISAQFFPVDLGSFLSQRKDLCHLDLAPFALCPPERFVSFFFFGLLRSIGLIGTGFFFPFAAACCPVTGVITSLGALGLSPWLPSFPARVGRGWDFCFVFRSISVSPFSSYTHERMPFRR